MERRGLEPALLAELGVIAAAEGCELLDTRLAGGSLRLVLDRPDGAVTLADCERVSKQASAALDVFDYGKASYTLEVSSPGLDRELYGPRDYERFAGRLARITFRPAQGEPRQTVVGRLEEFRAAGSGEVLVLETFKTKTKEHVIPVPAIEHARLEVEI